MLAHALTVRQHIADQTAAATAAGDGDALRAALHAARLVLEATAE